MSHRGLFNLETRVKPQRPFEPWNQSLSHRGLLHPEPTVWATEAFLTFKPEIKPQGPFKPKPSIFIGSSPSDCWGANEYPNVSYPWRKLFLAVGSTGWHLLWFFMTQIWIFPPMLPSCFPSHGMSSSGVRVNIFHSQQIILSFECLFIMHWL